MPALREPILAALRTRLSALPASVRRGALLPERVPAGGLLIPAVGEPWKAEVTLSPLACHYRHRDPLPAPRRDRGGGAESGP